MFAYWLYHKLASLPGSLIERAEWREMCKHFENGRLMEKHKTEQTWPRELCRGFTLTQPILCGGPPLIQPILWATFWDLGLLGCFPSFTLFHLSPARYGGCVDIPVLFYFLLFLFSLLLVPCPSPPTLFNSCGLWSTQDVAEPLPDICKLLFISLRPAELRKAISPEECTRWHQMRFQGNPVCSLASTCEIQCEKIHGSETKAWWMDQQWWIALWTLSLDLGSWAPSS